MRHNDTKVKRNVLQITQNGAKTLAFYHKMVYNISEKREANGLTVFEHLNKQIRDHNLLYKYGDEMGRVSMIEIRGKITFAYELGLITPDEWETLICKVFLILDGE